VTAPLPATAEAAAPVRAWIADVIAAERDALDTFVTALPPSLDAIVALLASQVRPLVCTGVGKSGLVAAKLAATFSSLGTPALALNAADAAHGDLGAVQSGSVLLMLSNSGATEELLRIVPLLKARGCRLVGILGRTESPLGRACDHVIPAAVSAEADHLGLAPTASTTLHMAIGDALAVATSRARGFTREDFLRHHPAGLLGRQMMPVATLMRTGADLPAVRPGTPVAELLAVMSAQRMGAAAVTDGEGRLLGLVCDGDIRRLILARGDVYAVTAADVMQRAPTVVPDHATLGDVLRLLRATPAGLLVLPVVDPAGRLSGMLHASDLLLQ
jgi:arabinose-5-phosphate isomerase